MTELVRRHEAQVPTTYDFWDPARIIRDFMRSEPWREPTTTLATVPSFGPDFDIRETKETYVLDADLPGLRDEDVTVTIAGNRLTVAGKRQLHEKQHGEAYYAIERMHGYFTRSFILPEGADPDRVQATLENGVLILIVPKRPEDTTRRVPVKTIK